MSADCCWNPIEDVQEGGHRTCQLTVVGTLLKACRKVVTEHVS